MPENPSLASALSPKTAEPLLQPLRAKSPGNREYLRSHLIHLLQQYRQTGSTSISYKLKALCYNRQKKQNGAPSSKRLFPYQSKYYTPSILPKGYTAPFSFRSCFWWVFILTRRNIHCPFGSIECCDHGWIMLLISVAIKTTTSRQQGGGPGF